MGFKSGQWVKVVDIDNWPNHFGKKVLLGSIHQIYDVRSTGCVAINKNERAYSSHRFITVDSLIEDV